MEKQKVSLVRCGSYDPAEVEAAVKRSVDLLGGIERFVKPGETVLLKPNLLTDTEPEKGITTHPEVVRSVIRLIKPLTPHVLCGDSPSVWGQRRDIGRVYETTGMKKICDEEGIRLVDFTQPVMKAGLPLAQWAFKVDRLVNIPKFKTHGYTVLTAALKNLFGLIVGVHKMKVHLDHPKPAELSKVIVDIYQARRPDLNILDGVVAMEGEGPGSAGTLRKMDLISASADGLCMDTVLAALMETGASDIPTNKEAISRGLGSGDLGSIEIVGEKLRDFIASGFRMPKTSALSRMPKMPRWMAGVLTSFLLMKPCPVVSRCKLCGACQKSCPVSAIRRQGERMVFDRARCIACLCCLEICPYNAVELRRSFLLRILAR